MSTATTSKDASAKADAFDIASLFVADKAASTEASITLAALAKEKGSLFLSAIGLNDALIEALNEGNPAIREAACTTISTLCGKGPGYLPAFISSGASSPFHVLLETFADEEEAVKDSAIAAVKAVVWALNPYWCTTSILPVVLERFRSARKSQVRTGCLEVLQQLIALAPGRIGPATADIIPVLTDALCDDDAEVRKAAFITVECFTALVKSIDITHLIPALPSQLSASAAAIVALGSARCPGPGYYATLPSQPRCLASTLTDVEPLIGASEYYVPATLVAPDVPSSVRAIWKDELAPAVVAELRSRGLPWITIHVVGIARCSWSTGPHFDQARAEAPTVLWVGMQCDIEEHLAKEAVVALRDKIESRIPGIEVEMFIGGTSLGAAVLADDPWETLRDLRVKYEAGMGMEIDVGHSRGTMATFHKIKGDADGLYGLTCQHVLCPEDRDGKLLPGDVSNAEVIFRDQTRLRAEVDEMLAEADRIEVDLREKRADFAPIAGLLDEPEPEDIVGQDRTAVRMRFHAEVLRNQISSLEVRERGLRWLSREVDEIGDAANRVIGRSYCYDPRRACVVTRGGRAGKLPDSHGWTEDWGLIKLSPQALGTSPRLNGIGVSSQQSAVLRCEGSAVGKDNVLWVKEMMSFDQLEAFLSEGNRTVVLRGATSGISLGHVLPLESVTIDLDPSPSDTEGFSFDIGVVGERRGALSREGDSGGPVVDTQGRLVGILGGGVRGGQGAAYDISLVRPIAFIMGQLQEKDINITLA